MRDGDVVIQVSCSEPRRRQMLLLGCAGVLAAATVGCAGGPKPPKPTVVTGTVQASADLNPSVSQRPSPLMLRIYELKSSASFDQADFMSLYQSDTATLGADVVGREEITLQPGETRPYNKQLNADTRFVAVFAAYRNLERARWRVAVPVQPGQSQKLSIRADALAVSAQVSP